jgi:hypothetical protein
MPWDVWEILSTDPDRVAVPSAVHSGPRKMGWKMRRLFRNWPWFLRFRSRGPNPKVGRSLDSGCKVEPAEKGSAERLPGSTLQLSIICPSHTLARAVRRTPVTAQLYQLPELPIYSSLNFILLHLPSPCSRSSRPRRAYPLPLR